MKKVYILGIALITLVGAGFGYVLFGPTGSGDSATNTITNTMSPHTDKKFIEIVNPSGFVNTDDKPIKIADYVGKKIIMLDVMTYSCINCQRTFPYAVAWYNKYKDDGLIIIGIHTPEFAFEKDKSNVAAAMKKFGITFPVVLDNDYGTWNAYGNQYWPRKYIIDINGNIVYDHIGEGGYEETEMKIKELLAERAQVLGEQNTVGMDTSLAASSIKEVEILAQSPETYIGSGRNVYLENGKSGAAGEQTLTLPKILLKNKLYLGGTWNFMPEYATGNTGAVIDYSYNAQDVYLVMDADQSTDVEVWQDGMLVTPDASGEDVSDSGIVTVKESRLYKLIHNQTPGAHTLELRIKGSGMRAYAFTFG